ncbi:unnamed protein product [Closterium sp. Yama58-4]|nr:unnamed protein product [Closterium sp. Yama58-4]
MAGGMEFKLNGFVVKVQPTLETAGQMAEIVAGAKERSEELEAQVKRQDEAMAALKREPAPNDEALMALVECMIAARVKDVRDELESQVKGLKEQVEAARREARDAAREVRALSKRQSAEIADVRATAAHIDARMNDVELAVAEWKDARETTRAERCNNNDGSAGQNADAERREGKKRKREVTRNRDELADSAGAADDAEDDDNDDAASDEKRDEGDDSEWEEEWQEVKTTVVAVGTRVAKLEKTSDEGKRVWEAMLTLWAAAAPGQTRMNLSGISCLSDAALTRLASLRHLIFVDLKGSSGFSASGMRQLYSLAGLNHLIFGAIDATDAALEGISRLANLRILVLDYTKITDAGVARLQELSGLTALSMTGCASVSSASMVHVGRMTSLQFLTLNASGVKEDGLQHLTALTSLTVFTLPPGVTDLGIRHLRNMKHLQKLALWDASITASGMMWLQKVATCSYKMEELIRDNLPGVVISGTLND